MDAENQGCTGEGVHGRRINLTSSQGEFTFRDSGSVELVSIPEECVIRAVVSFEYVRSRQSVANQARNVAKQIPHQSA